ncbi:hypothetical protein ACMHYB_45645 [Sorangium sp. So ce1128]
MRRSRSWLICSPRHTSSWGARASFTYALSPEALRSRKLRDAAYTLVVNAERRLRAAAEYWYAGTDKMKGYAPFPTSRGAASAGEGEEGEDGAADEGAADEPDAEVADEDETEAEATEDVEAGDDDAR